MSLVHVPTQTFNGFIIPANNKSNGSMYYLFIYFFFVKLHFFLVGHFRVLTVNTDYLKIDTICEITFPLYKFIYN